MERGVILLPSIIQQPMSSTPLLGIHLAPGSGRTLHLRKKATAGLISRTPPHLREEVKKIERMANWVVRENHPVIIKTYDRGDAEQQFSFRIYQGGIVPTSNVRIVNINGWDIEACGGTHVKSTGEIGLVKIVKSERIQDGVVRLEFVAGEAAVSYMQQLDSQLASISHTLGSSREKVIQSFDKAMQDAEAAKKKLRAMLRVVSGPIAKSISEQAKRLDSGIHLYTI